MGGAGGMRCFTLAYYESISTCFVFWKTVQPFGNTKEGWRRRAGDFGPCSSQVFELGVRHVSGAAQLCGGPGHPRVHSCVNPSVLW